MVSLRGPSGQDEARVGQQGTLTRLWARKGSPAPARRRTAATSGVCLLSRTGGGRRLFGAVYPARVTGAARVMPHADTEAMNAHLAEISRQVTPGPHALLVLDGAGWHSSKSLVLPEIITLMPLPPYSPELNPVENLWQYLRQNNLANPVFDSYENIVYLCCTAWNTLMAMPQRLASITRRKRAQVRE